MAGLAELPSRHELPDLIRSARERKGLSQSQAHKVCGVSRMTYRMWEKGTWEQIRLRYVPAIAKFCDVREEDILETIGVLTPEASDALRKARKRGSVHDVIDADNMTGWETGRQVNRGPVDPGQVNRERCASIFAGSVSGSRSHSIRAPHVSHRRPAASMRPSWAHRTGPGSSYPGLRVWMCQR